MKVSRVRGAVREVGSDDAGLGTRINPLRMGVLLLAVLGAGFSRIASGQFITEFPIPTASSIPIGIAAGPDGNLWFTEGGGNKIGRITTAGAITEFPIPT